MQLTVTITSLLHSHIKLERTLPKTASSYVFLSFITLSRALLIHKSALRNFLYIIMSTSNHYTQIIFNLPRFLQAIILIDDIHRAKASQALAMRIMNLNDICKKNPKSLVP